MTYQELLDALCQLGPPQLACDVTVENLDGECLPAELRICDIEHMTLDEGHPVIYIL